MFSFDLRAAACLSLIAGGMLMASGADAGTALVGEWGGPQVQLSLTAAGGRIEFSCAAATIAAIRPDPAGKFSADGRHEEFTGGPVQADAAPAATPARYTGQVDGDTLQLTVHRQGRAAETYTLQRGKRSKLIRCY